MNQQRPEEFLEACGARGPLVLQIERQGQSGAVRQTLSLPFAVVGRDERADLRLEDERVSNRHAYLQVSAGRLWFTDLGSRTGTHGPLGGPAGLLCRGQDLRIGPFVVRLVDGSSQDDEAVPLLNPLASKSSALSSLPRVGLHFLEGTASQPPLWMLDRVLTLMGRADTCRVRLRSPTVSRAHGALLLTPAGLWVVDLLGWEGLSVNGTMVRWALLEDADELRIGEFLVRVRFLDPPQHAALPALVTKNVDSTVHALPPPKQSLVPSASIAEALPADLEGLLSALMQSSPTPSAIAPATDKALLLPLIRQFSLMQQQMFDQFQQALEMIVQMFSGLHRDQLHLIRQELNRMSELTRELQKLQAEQARQTSVPKQTEIVLPTPPRPLPPSADAVPSSVDVHTWLAKRLATLQQERQNRWQRILSVLTGK